MKHKFTYETIRSLVKISNESETLNLIVSTSPQPRKRLHKDVEVIPCGTAKTYDKDSVMGDIVNLSFRFIKEPLW
jgi:hypothetical protein